MATYYSAQVKGVLDGAVPIILSDGSQIDANLRSSHAVFSYAGQVNAIADVIVPFEFPAFSIFEELRVFTDTVLTGVTLNVGNAANATKYGAIVALAANAETILMPAALLIAPAFAASERVLITVTAAALPAAGNMVIRARYQIAGG
jgi:hypothetical protein